ncbi:hypothetical protein [Roseovarius ramblicola]|uniref:Uncharacterized protein n=1 Tax=Roseovarius ramblicola TaxID=2022336 RepID=A0ABV5HWB5_9RHOB
MSDAMPIFRTVRSGTPEAQALRRSRDYVAGWIAGKTAAQGLYEQMLGCIPTQRDRLEEEGDRLGISRPEIGRIWVRMIHNEPVHHLFPEIDWHFVIMGERKTEDAA